MGIMIRLKVSDTTTQAEWEPAYEESLRLIDRFPLMTLERVCLHGIEMVCCVPPQERESYWRRGWSVCGDMATMRVAESNKLWRVLPEPSKEPPVDVLFSCLDSMNLEGAAQKYPARHREFWNGSTQGDPVHLYLLAIACLLEDLLPERITCSGDITLGQCRRAVRLASEAMGREIRMPVRCDLNRLYERVRAMPLEACDVIRSFGWLYLGPKDGDFGQFLRDHFTPDELSLHWTRGFRKYQVSMFGFQELLTEYLATGFPVPDLRAYAGLEDRSAEDVQKVLTLILNAELHIPEKDCENIIGIDSNSETPYGIGTLMIMYRYRLARNERVDRYIPLPELQAQLEACMGDLCDVPAGIAAWTAERAKEEKSEAENVRETLRTARAHDLEQWEKFDVTDYKELLRYQPGWTIAPDLEKDLVKSFRALRSASELKSCEEFRTLTPKSQFWILARKSALLNMTVEDWETVWDRLHTDQEAIARYFPVAVVDLRPQIVNDVVKALVCNDALYEYCLKRLEAESETPEA